MATLEDVIAWRRAELAKMPPGDVGYSALESIILDLTDAPKPMHPGKERCPGCLQEKYIGYHFTVCMSCREASKPKTMCLQCGYYKHIAVRGNGICLPCRKGATVESTA